jgi:hypothetical protein
VTTVASRPVEAAGLEFELPDGWWSLDVRPPRLADRLDELLSDALGPATSADVRDRVRASVARLAADGAHCLLLRPALGATDVAVTGGVFTLPPFGLDGADLYSALDERGEAVALGDLDGVPIVSMVRRVPAGGASEIAILQIIYLVCAGGGSVMLTFAAADEIQPGRVVREVARVVSAARVVR